jgi:hypothetical protein
LRDQYQRWAAKTRTHDEATVDNIETFLEYLAEEYAGQPSPSSDYVLDLAGKYFNQVRIKERIEQARDALADGDDVQALEILRGTPNVELGEGAVITPGEDWDVWVQAFDRERQKPLVRYPGDLGKLVGDSFARGKLFAFMGPDKVGKSFWLLDLAYRAVRKGWRVSFFDLGDMDQDEVMQRLAQRALRRPLKAGDIAVPVEFDKQTRKLVRDVETFKAVGPSDGFREFQKICRGTNDLLKISCHPNSSIDVMGISSILKEWAREGWVVDVVVMDYADILAPSKGARDNLEAIDKDWRELRRLSQELHCLTVTATQANAASYRNEGGKLLTRWNFSGRKTKLAHVNGMLGLNVSPQDKKQGITRVNWVVRRKGFYVETTAVTVAGHQDLAHPVIISRF